MAVLFNFIPGAGLIAPGTFFEVNSGGQFTSKSRGVVLGHKSAAGSLADNVLTLCSTVGDAALLAGAGSQLYESFRLARRMAPVQEYWVGSVPVTGTPGQWTLTLTAMAAAGGDGVIEIAGREITVSVGLSEPVATSAANLAAAINAFYDRLTQAYLPVTATSAAGVVTLTARHAGATMNELDIFVDDALPGNVYAGKIAVANSVPATGAASVSTVLANLGDEPFDWIIAPYSDSAALNAAQAAFSDLLGRWAWNIQLYGHYFTVNTGNTADNVTFGLARNDRHISTLARVASPTPSWEWIAAYAGRHLPWLADDTNGNAARNQSDLPLEGIRPPRDRSLWPNYAVRNTLLGSGMSTWRVNGSGQVVIDKCITMERLNAAGQPDAEFRNIQRMAIAVHCLRYLRAGLSFRHTNKSYMDANPGNLDAVSTNDDIRVDLIELLVELELRGLIENAAETAKLLGVVRDATNSSRCNIIAIADGVDPLDIFAGNLTFRRLNG